MTKDKMNSPHCTSVGVDKKIPPTKWTNRRIGGIFRDMKQRCYNKNNKDYKWYGAKDIKVCNEWLSNPKLFEEWSLQHGYNNELTIDRIDENKGYSPDNCRWIDVSQNSKYKSTTSVIDVDGIVHTGRDWSILLGFGVNTIDRYIRKYGQENTIEFIRRYRRNPELRLSIASNKNIYKLYMQ